MRSTIAMIMAGGKGTRLGPLTVHRSKPSVPFAGRYRIIDFVLSNFVNSSYRRVYVLTQYMASSMIKHLNRNWHLGGINEYVEVVPAQMRQGEHWYRGTADSIYQNLNLIHDSRARHVAVFGGDHIYKLAIDQMELFHREQGADLTIAAFPVPRSEASEFGVMQVDKEGRIIGFQEKPANPAPMPGNPDMCLVSMGNYFFRTQVLVEALTRDAKNTASAHDFGRNVIPALLSSGARIMAYDVGMNEIRGEPPGGTPYWRDVGTIDSYFVANMELRSPLPALNLYNRRWRIRTAQRDYPPARFVKHLSQPACEVVDSLVAEGSIVQSARLDDVMVGYDCFVHAGAHLRRSLLLSGCDVGQGAILDGVLVDKNCIIDDNTEIGVDAEADRQRFPFVTESGLVVLPKGTHVPRTGPILFPGDMMDLLTADPATCAIMKAFGDRVKRAGHDRHSYRSAGPRYVSDDGLTEELEL